MIWMNSPAKGFAESLYTKKGKHTLSLLHHGLRLFINGTLNSCAFKTAYMLYISSKTYALFFRTFNRSLSKRIIS